MSWELSCTGQGELGCTSHNSLVPACVSPSSRVILSLHRVLPPLCVLLSSMELLLYPGHSIARSNSAMTMKTFFQLHQEHTAGGCECLYMFQTLLVTKKSSTINTSTLQHWGSLVPIPARRPPTWSLHVLPVFVWASPRYSGFISH